MSGRVYGVVFLALVVLAVYMTYAVFTKAFVDYDEVTLEASKVGLSMPARADVKIRGVIVGEVLETATSGDGAKLTLGLYPEERDTIPANVTAQILPKTLFGEKYVALQVPESPDGQAIAPGDTIERSDVAIEVEQVINDLFPLLRTVEPAQLNFALTALANSLEGRGNDIGEAFETLDSYLKRFNPEVPAFLDNLENLGKVSALYEDIVPELTAILRNQIRTTNTFQSREDQVQALFDDVAGFADTSREFLNKNGEDMVTLSRQGAQILPVFERYAPEYPCLLAGIVASIPRAGQAFRDKILHIKLEPLPRQPRGYDVRDDPQHADNRGAFPYCHQIYDGIRGKYSQNNLIPDSLIPQIQTGVNYPLGKRSALGDAVVGSAAQQAVLDVAASRVLQRPVDEVPDLASLLLGPIAMGKGVDVR